MTALIFDMDGVLVDSEPLHYEACRRVVEPFGVDLSVKEFTALWLGHSRGLREGLKRHKVPLSLEEARRRKHAFFVELARKQLTVRPGVRALLRATEHLPRAVATSSGWEMIDTILGLTGLRENFSVIVSGLDLLRGKPAPDIFLEAARCLGVPPETCIVFEDARPGLLAAKAAGMRCVVVPTQFTRHQDFSPADLVVNRLDDPQVLAFINQDSGQP